MLLKLPSALDKTMSMKLRPPYMWKVAQMGERSEEGTVTAELAIGLPAVVLMLIFSLSVGAITIARTSVQEAARTGARLASTGVNVKELPKGSVAPGMKMTQTQSGPWVTVTARKAVHVAGFSIPAGSVTASATAYLESEIGSAQ